MINIEKLKPIIEPLLSEENAASIIEAIQAIDEPVVGITQEDLDAKDREWNERFKQAFLSAVVEAVEETTEEQDEPEDITIEDIFTAEEV